MLFVRSIYCIMKGSETDYVKFILVYFLTAYCEVSSVTLNSTQALQMLSSGKLMLRGVLTKIKVCTYIDF